MACSLIRIAGLGVAAAVLSAGPAGCTERTVTQRRNLEVAAVPGTGLRVDTDNGSVSAEAGEGSAVRIEAEVRAQPARIDRVQVRAERDETGALWVSADWPEGGRKSGEGASFSIVGPGFTGQTIRTSNGRITLIGQAGDADVETSNGALKVVSHAGAVNARTTNGSITAEGVSGALRGRTSNGRVEVRGAEGPVKVRTSNGSVSVVMSGAATGPVEAESSNGSVTLTVGASFRGEISASTSNGRVSVEGAAPERVSMSRSRARVSLGEGEGSTLSTSNGSVTITVLPAGAGPASDPAAKVRPAAVEPLAGSGELPPR